MLNDLNIHCTKAYHIHSLNLYEVKLEVKLEVVVINTFTLLDTFFVLFLKKGSIIHSLRIYLCQLISCDTYLQKFMYLMTDSVGLVGTYVHTYMHLYYFNFGELNLYIR